MATTKKETPAKTTATKTATKKPAAKKVTTDLPLDSKLKGVKLAEKLLEFTIKSVLPSKTTK